MSDSNRLSLALSALALFATVMAVFGSSGATAPALALSSRGQAVGTPFELLLFGTSLDDQSLPADAPPLIVYTVPADFELRITDVDATSDGLVLWRGSAQQPVQVGFVVDRAAVGLGQCSRSYATGIRFGPGDGVLVGPAGSDVEWAALRGVLTPVEPPVPGP